LCVEKAKTHQQFVKMSILICIMAMQICIMAMQIFDEGSVANVPKFAKWLLKTREKPDNKTSWRRYSQQSPKEWRKGK
jgi:hypothetical protein